MRTPVWELWCPGPVELPHGVGVVPGPVAAAVAAVAAVAVVVVALKGWEPALGSCGRGSVTVLGGGPRPAAARVAELAGACRGRRTDPLYRALSGATS
jgi:hypothetical protein